MSSYGTTPCQKAMNNLEALLTCYDGFNQTSLESIFDNTFDQKIRMDLNGRTYKREFLKFQESKNFDRSLKVYDIEMEVLDSESFHYTFRVEDCSESDNDESSCFSSSTASLSSTFHSLATVKNGKIVKIKPMTGSAYVDLFESNIILAAEESEEKATKPTQEEKKSRKTGKKRMMKCLSGMFTSKTMATAE